MRSHAKASSAGSNPDRGASRRSLRRPGALATLLIALVASACALPGSAFAIEYRSKTGSFGPDGTAGTSFTEYLGPLTFDQGAKRLYALDQEEQEISGFDTSTPGSHTPLGGAFPLSAPSAGTEDDIAVDSSSHRIYYDSKGGKKVYGFDESGGALSGGFPITAAGGAFEAPCGVTVDSSGNVWVADRKSSLLSVFDSAGTFTTPYVLGTTKPCRIALDSAENLYVAEQFGPTVEYTVAGEYTESKVIDPDYTYAIAVDRSTNEIYAVHLESISVYDETGAFLYEFGAGGEYYGEFGGIAIDEGSEEVFVSDYGNHKVDVFGPPLSLPKLTTDAASGVTATEATVNGTVNPRGLAVEECHFEVVPASQFISSKYENVTGAEKYPCVPAAGSIPADSNPHAVSAAVTGLNPATVYHYRLVAKNSIGEAKGLDGQFTSGAVSPLVEEESVEAVGTGEATLAAKINPRGGETTFHVEYGTSNAYGQSTTESAPFGFASDTSKHAVSVHIGGLEPGTAYHFRFVATNGVGGANGADATFATYPASGPTFAPCPNDQFRTGAGFRLPDCRAYEQGTPIEKHGANARISNSQVGVAASGDRFTFYALGGLPTTGGSSVLYPYLASRGPGGWSTDGLLPSTESGGRANVIGVNEDLSAALVIGEGPGGVGEQLFVRDSETASFQPGPAVSGGFQDTNLVNFAADVGHLIFNSKSQLLPSAPAGKSNLYDLDHGTLTLADRVPAGATTSCDDEAGPACIVPSEGSTYGVLGHKISGDGSRVFFTVNPTELSLHAGRIYMREDGTRTTWISASQRTTPDPNGEKPAELAGVTPDGSKVFFTSCEKLTDDSTAHSTGENKCVGLGEPQQGQDLYSYDVETGELTDLTVDPNAGDPLGAAVQGLLGTSEDGSYAYFVAAGVLAPGASNDGECWDLHQKCNLYVYHHGVTTFIARLRLANEVSIGSVSADGSSFVFITADALTGYNNIGGCTNGKDVIPCPEFFRYNAPEEQLLCVTCLPTGIPPSAQPRLGEFSVVGDVGGGANPGSHNLSADGNRFFFNSPDALLPGDTNHVVDVYEWEAKGAGTCESENQDGGCIYLISSGTDPRESSFLGASKDGDHAFFSTEQQLVPTDQDQLFDIYDAGIGAGLASQHTLSTPTCTSTACQANPAPPPDPSLASAAYSGAGNVHSATKGRKCPKGKRKVRSGGKVSCRKAHKQHKRHTNRGGSK